MAATRVEDDPGDPARDTPDGEEHKAAASERFSPDHSGAPVVVGIEEAQELLTEAVRVVLEDMQLLETTVGAGDVDKPPAGQVAEAYRGDGGAGPSPSGPPLTLDGDGGAYGFYVENVTTGGDIGAHEPSAKRSRTSHQAAVKLLDQAKKSWRKAAPTRVAEAGPAGEGCGWMTSDVGVRLFHLARRMDTGKSFTSTAAASEAVAVALRLLRSDLTDSMLCSGGMVMLQVTNGQSDTSTPHQLLHVPQPCTACHRGHSKRILQHEASVVARCSGSCLFRWHADCFDQELLAGTVVAGSRKCLSPTCERDLRSVQTCVGSRRQAHPLFIRFIEEEAVTRPGVATLYPEAEVRESRPGPQRLSATARPTMPVADSTVPRIPMDAQVIVVLGATGIGKTSTAIRIASADGEWSREEIEEAMKPPQWRPKQAVVSQFGADPSTAMKWMSTVGLNSVPSWCKPYDCLSTGQAYRADLARKLAAADGGNKRRRALLLLDDFTGHLDRLTAICCATSLGKVLRTKPRVRAIVSCSNGDVLPWLQPDCVVYVRKPHATCCDSLRHAHLDVRVLRNMHAGAKPTVIVELQPERPGHAAWSLRDIRAPMFPGLELVKSLVCAGDQDFQFEFERETRPRGGVVLMTSVAVDEATGACDALFDLPFDGTSHFRVPDFPASTVGSDFCLGLICGPSGTSKSVLLELHFGGERVPSWGESETVRDVLCRSDESTAAARLVAVGLEPSEVMPSLINTLSAGRRHQVFVAAALGDHGAVIDEFTSCLDRATAITMAAGVSRYCREHAMQRMVFAGCHNDIVSSCYFAPDWIYDTATLACHWLRCSDDSTATVVPVPTPQILHEDWFVEGDDPGPYDGVLSIAPPTVQCKLVAAKAEAWRLFREMHYKTPNLSPSASPYVLLATTTGPDGFVPAGFVATIRHTGREDVAADDCTVAFRAHRTVVLPEWQGMGLGSRLSDAAAHLHWCQKQRYFGQTVHPRFGQYRDRSPLWRATRWNHTTSEFKIETWRQRRDGVRVKLRTPKFAYSHEYIGPHDDETRAYLKERVRVGATASEA